jgi:hypothetical protein
VKPAESPQPLRAKGYRQRIQEISCLCRWIGASLKPCNAAHAEKQRLATDVILQRFNVQRSRAATPLRPSLCFTRFFLPPQSSKGAFLFCCCCADPPPASLHCGSPLFALRRRLGDPLDFAASAVRSPESCCTPTHRADYPSSRASCSLSSHLCSPPLRLEQHGNAPVECTARKSKSHLHG